LPNAAGGDLWNMFVLANRYDFVLIEATKADAVFYGDHDLSLPTSSLEFEEQANNQDQAKSPAIP